MPTTSTPKKLGEGPSVNEPIDVSPVKLASQQPETSKDTSLDLDWLDSYVDWLHDENRKNTQGDEGSTWQDNYTRCDVCGTCCRIASHLRQSEDCLRQFRSQSEFQFQGAANDNVFITKTALLIGECPNPSCPTGRHPDQIPPDCVEWWKREGWKIMRWKGNKETANYNIIKEKIREFVKFQKKKKNQSNRAQHGAESSQASTDGAPSSTDENHNRCSSCTEDGDLVQHLQTSSECLDAYVKHYLGQNLVDIRTSLFRLSIFLNICVRSDCSSRRDFTYLRAHLNRNEACLEFYQNEGAHLELWNVDVSSQIISKKIAHMKRVMKQSKTNDENCGYAAYTEELTHVLEHVCCKCGVMGPPVEGEDDFVLRGGWTDVDGGRVWFCSKCTEDSPGYDDVEEKLRENTEKLKGPRTCHENVIKVVKSPTSARLIVAPSCFGEDSAEASEIVPSMSTAVLVPYDGSAVRAIMGLCDEAAPDGEELRTLVEDLLSRPFVTDFETTFSCLYRWLLADIRKKMNRISSALSKSARGEIISQNPNVTSARKRNQNINMTTAGALRDSCTWSLLHGQQKSLESEAMAQKNGRIKIHFKGTIINGLQDKNLRRILLLGYKYFERGDVNSFEELENIHPSLEGFISSMTPMILKYIHAKVNLFIKHIVAPNFSDYNLKLEISDQGLQVQIQGYLYTKQFNQANKLLAESPQLALLPEISSIITKEEDVLPTTTLSWESLTNNYKLTEIRAKKIIEIVQHCQVGTVASPLSLLNLWTPSEWIVREQEKVLRFRVEQLSIRVNNDQNTEEAIIAITKTLLDEGLFEELVFEDIDQEVRQSMRASLIGVSSSQDPLSINALVWYHTLLLKTGGDNQWTLRRECGETSIIPYNPLLLEALEEQVEVRIAMDAEHLEVDQNQGRSELMAGTAWREISLLNFLHGVSLKNYKDPTSLCMVSVIASQEQEYNFRDSDEKDEECDDVYTNSKGESFIITNGDLRKLYMKRPPSVEALTFAQFVISYYRMRPSQQAIIDPQTGVGRETAEVVVGGGGVSLPTFMRLSNGIIMKKRSDPSKMVPVLLNTREIDDYGSRLLFQPWRNVEELVEGVSDDDKRRQQQNCLAIFPMGIFSRQESQ